MHFVSRPDMTLPFNIDRKTDTPVALMKAAVALTSERRNHVPHFDRVFARILSISQFQEAHGQRDENDNRQVQQQEDGCRERNRLTIIHDNLSNKAV